MNPNEEKLLREFVRRSIVKPALKVLKEEKRKEDAVRLWVRSKIHEMIEQQNNTVIFEGKEMTNPHPNTGINKLRDAIRKAKPSIKSKFQQLTTSEEQRESFEDHFLAAFSRLFDQLDALSAVGEPEDIKAGLKNAEDNPLEIEPGEEMKAPEQSDLDDLDKQINSILEGLMYEEDEGDENLNPEDPEKENDIVSDELSAEKERKKELSQVEKDIEKKKNINVDRKKFGAGIKGDTTGRNQAYDTFNLVQSYLSDAYLDLDNPEDKDMFKKWGLYNMKLLIKSYDEELKQDVSQPDIEKPI